MISFAIAIFLFLRKTSIDTLEREGSISDKTEKNTKADTQADELP